MALLDSMNARERRLVIALGGIAAVLVVLLVPLRVSAWLSSREKYNDDLRQAILDVQGARGRVAQRRAAIGDVAARYARPAPPLATLIDTASKASGLEVATQNDLAPVPRGKLYTERSTKLTVQKTGLKALANFLEKIETSGYPVAVTQLDLGKRIEPDAYQVNMTISAFDRAETAPQTAGPGASASGGHK
jgi:general secretion pathway protein M